MEKEDENKMNELIQTILKKMHETVGATYTPRDCMKQGWFQKYWWTETEEEKYKEFVVKMLIENKEFRRVFLNNFVRKDVKVFKKAIDWFCFDYGWTILLLKEIEGVKGYLIKDIKQVMSKEQYKQFDEWSKGRTVMRTEKGVLIHNYDFDKFLKTLKDRRRK